MKILLLALFAVSASTWAAPLATVKDAEVLLSQQLRQLGISLTNPTEYEMNSIKDQVTDIAKTVTLMYERLAANHGVTESDSDTVLEIVKNVTLEAIRDNPTAAVDMFHPGPLMLESAKLSVIGESLSRLADVLDESVKSFDALTLFQESAAAEYFITEAHDIIEKVENFVHQLENDHDEKKFHESRDDSMQEIADHSTNAEEHSDMNDNTESHSDMDDDDKYSHGPVDETEDNNNDHTDDKSTSKQQEEYSEDETTEQQEYSPELPRQKRQSNWKIGLGHVTYTKGNFQVKAGPTWKFNNGLKITGGNIKFTWKFG